MSIHAEIELEDLSLAQRLAQLPPDQREAMMAGIDPEEFLHDWSSWRRKSQTPPDGDWSTWLLMAGRGAGKTRTASEWIHERVRNGLAKRILLLGRTAADVRDVMIHGEALALDTVIPTPTGWTTMGRIKEGDTVIGGDGAPCRVEEAYDVLKGRTCYRVAFKSGATVVADADHKWLTWDAKARKARPPRAAKVQPIGTVLTTKEIADSFWAGGQGNHAVDVVGARYEQEPYIQIDPYTLGVWIGCGDEDGGSGITLTGDDTEQILAQAGKFYQIHPRSHSDGSEGGWTVERLKPLLKDAGLLKEKHIPVQYLRMIGSHRLALLQGIMDTAGRVDASGGCEIVVSSVRLRDDLVELLASLRIVATEATSEPSLKANRSLRVVKGEKTYRILFRTTVPVSTLERNLVPLERNTDAEYDYIVSINKIQTVPVRCIRVDSPDHCFMVTNRYIPTHNSGLLNTGRPDDRPEYFPSKRLVVWPNGAEALLLSADEPDQARGPQADTAWCIAGDAKVITHRGWIPIKDVREGDQVMTRQDWKRVDVARAMGVKPVIQITTATGMLRCTPDHRIWTLRHGWMHAGELPVGEFLREPNGNGVAVVSIDIGGEVPTYDLTVHDAHEFYADGILVKNCDEFASFPGMTGSDGATAFDNLRLGLRLPVPGDQPRMILTTTPRRTKAMFDILEQAKDPKFGIVITRGSTYENLGNLADSFKSTIIGLYEGTRLGRQELMGEMLTDIEGALFLQEWFDLHRVTALPSTRMYAVVGVDPSVAERPSDECGIIVVKATMEKDFYKRHVYICEDASVKGSPDIWSARVAAMARKWQAPIVAEGNQGGELVRMAIAQADSNLPVHIVHAKTGKATRAEPIAAALQQGRIHMVGWHGELEDQMCSWIPAESRYSPDRLDAAVWGCLSVLTRQKGVSFALGRHLRARSSRSRLPSLNSSLFAAKSGSGRR